MYKERIIDFVLDFPESWFRNGQLPKVAYFSGFTNYVKGTTLYSSGTAMSRNVIESLLESDGFSAENMMKKYTVFLLQIFLLNFDCQFVIRKYQVLLISQLNFVH